MIKMRLVTIISLIMGIVALYICSLDIDIFTRFFYAFPLYIGGMAIFIIGSKKFTKKGDVK
jgi:hypothetical protein